MGLEPIRHPALLVALDGREVPVDGVPSRELSGQDGRPAGGANTAGNRELVELAAFQGKTIDVGRLQIGVPVAAEVTPAPVIGQDEDNVGSSLPQCRRLSTLSANEQT